MGINSSPVTVKKIELEIIDRAWEAGWVVPEPPPMRTGQHVAVVGSGPAGLACAAQLNRAGHHVTVYDRADRPGGLLMYGIPAMKLAKEVVERRIALLAHEGITFRTGVEIGRDLDAGQRAPRTTPSCCAPARPSRATWRSRAGGSQASIPRWTSSASTPACCSRTRDTQGRGRL